MAKKISLIGVQTKVDKNPAQNLKNALELIDEAASLYKQADVIVLPEYFYEIAGKEKMGAYPEEIKEAFSDRARRYGTYIVGGTVLHRESREGKLRNTALFFGRDGEVLGSYDKVHLFDVLDCADKDKESHFCEHGDRLFTWDTDFGKVGIVVCYDIRFPELTRTLALQGVKFLLAPAAFISPRFDHWTDLVRVTAIQNSMYVLGVNLFGRLTGSFAFCGRSLLADPWGIAVAGASDKGCFFQAYVDPDYPEQISAAVGSISNRRPGVYDIP
ncbi:MAG: hypothetical protein LBG71_08295, partial [Clostridiales Family XIII bacterium]|nr:hypothetical protein [Clostridiales Family XIII bacterium]